MATRRTVTVQVGRRAVLLVELSTDDLKTATELAGDVEGQAARDFETALQGLRRSIRSIDGRDVAAAELEGDGLDQLFRVREIVFLARAWGRLQNPADDDDDRGAMLASIEDAIAYACRYGHQPYSEVVAMTRRDLGAFNRALGRLVERENESNETE